MHSAKLILRSVITIHFPSESALDRMNSVVKNFLGENKNLHSLKVSPYKIIISCKRKSVIL